MFFQLKKVLFVVLASFSILNFCSDDEKKSKELVVDVDHIISPSFTLDCFGRVIKISGGHDFLSYPEDVIKSQDVFISQDNSTFGVVFYKDNKKTFIAQKTFAVENLKENLTEGDIKKIAETSKTIGWDKSKAFKITRAENGCFYRIFKDDLKTITSQFPVFVVDEDKQTVNGRIKLGSFAFLQKNKNDFSLDKSEEIVVNKSEFYRLMKCGYFLETYKNKKFLIDITIPFEKSERGKAELVLRNLTNLPGKLYAYGYADIAVTSEHSQKSYNKSTKIIPGLLSKDQKISKKI